MIEIAKISRHSRSRESRDQDRDFDTALEVDGDLDKREKPPTLENDRSHDKKSRGILGLLFFVFASRTCFSNHRVLHLPRGSELKSGQGRFSADAASATA